MLQPEINIIPEVTSTAPVVREVQSSDKTTINIGVAMNHVNDQDNNTKQQKFKRALVIDNFDDLMDTQEGEFTFFQLVILFIF